MRVWLISAVAMILGISTGLSITWLEFRDTHEYFKPVSLTKPALSAVAESPDTASLPGPVAVVVGGAKFDFGTLNHDQTGEKAFTIRNAGTKPLVVSWGGESCGMCITNKHNFTSTSVPPGGACEVIVSYATKKPEMKFSESANLITNDPRNSSLQLQIAGFVTMALKLDPDALALNSISTSEPTAVSARLFGYHSDKLELIKHEFSNPTISSQIELIAKPLDAAAIKAEDHARAGLELQFQFKPGLPIGPLSQTVTLTALADTERTIVLPISGSVVGDLSIYGRSFDSSSATLNVGIVNRSVGHSVEIFMLVKGPARHDVKLSVGLLDPPDVLQVSIGDPAALADGKAIKFPIKFTIPKGAPAMNRLGNQQGKAGKLVLETTHPVSKQLPITVRFAVE